MRTKLSELLGIECPIVQAPMGWICGPRLVAAVSNAGGLGTLGINAGLLEAIKDPDEAKEEQRRQIRKVRELTSKPFAMNVAAGPKEYSAFADRYAELAIEEKVPVVVVSAGSANIYTRKLKGGGIKVLHTVSSVRQAQKAVEAGVDAVVAVGYEAGGHIGVERIPTFVLVPQVVDAVKVPVIAGGGVGDGRGLAAALMLGAQGVYMGTRFIATDECDAHPNVKQAIVRATDTGTAVIGSKIGFALKRQLRNKFSDRYMELEQAGIPVEELQAFADGRSRSAWGEGYGAAVGSYGVAFLKGNVDYGFVACGIAAGLINEVTGAGEIVRSMMNAAESIINAAR